MCINFILKELEKFTVVSFEEPHEVTVIKEIEKELKIQLPQDYKELLSYSNGVSLGSTEVAGLFPVKTGVSLNKLYEVEHSLTANPMPAYLVPFSPDGAGNHYCFDTTTNNEFSCSIVFWQYDYIYTQDDGPEVTNSSFFQWIKEVMIDWYLENYDYNGRARE